MIEKMENKRRKAQSAVTALTGSFHVLD